MEQYYESYLESSSLKEIYQKMSHLAADCAACRAGVKAIQCNPEHASKIICGVIEALSKQSLCMAEQAVKYSLLSVYPPIRNLSPIEEKAVKQMFDEITSSNKTLGKFFNSKEEK